jgi:hypothetical protein
VWDGVRRGLEEAGAGVTVRVEKTSFPHPRDAGARLTATWPVGQIADYEIDCGSTSPPLIIREFEDRYEAAIDGLAVGARAAAAAGQNATTAMYLGGAVLGGAIGTSLTNKREGMLVGAAIGVLFAAVLDVAIDSAVKPDNNDDSKERRE